MNVQVEAFNCEYSFLVQPHVTIGRIFERLARNLGMAPANRRFFGFKVFNERLQKVVWPSPTDSLKAAIQKGMKYKPIAVRFYLRAHAFPNSLDDLRGDRSALELLYRQAKNLVMKLNGGAGYRATESLLETTLLAMSMIVDCGAFVVASSATSGPEMTKAVTIRLVYSSEKVEKAVLHMWRLLGLMTASEAQFNFLNLLASSENYSVEKMLFWVQQQQKIISDGKKKKKQQLKVQLAVFYEGIEVIAEKVASDDENENSNETFKVTKMDWSEICSIKQRHSLLTIKIEKGEGHPPLKAVFSASSTFEAHLIYKLITAYHGEHLRRVSKSGSYPNAQGISTEVRFVLPQAEIFFGFILGQIVALDHCINELKLGSALFGEKNMMIEKKVDAEEEKNSFYDSNEENMSLVKDYSESEDTDYENSNVETAEIEVEQENFSGQQENEEEVEVSSNDNKGVDTLVASEPETIESKVVEKDSLKDDNEEMLTPSSTSKFKMPEEKVTAPFSNIMSTPVSSVGSKRESLNSSSSSQSGDDLLSDHSADLVATKRLPQPHFYKPVIFKEHAQQDLVLNNDESEVFSDQEILSKGFDFEGTEEEGEQLLQQHYLEEEVSSPYSYPGSFPYSLTTEEVSTASSEV